MERKKIRETNNGSLNTTQNSKIEQHETYEKAGMNSGAPESKAILAPVVANEKQKILHLRNRSKIQSDNHRNRGNIDTPNTYILYRSLLPHVF